MAYTEAQKKATTKYLTKLKDVRLRISHDEYALWSVAAKEYGFVKEDGTPNMRQFIMAAVKEKIMREMNKA